jgi:hypothetical protein
MRDARLPARPEAAEEGGLLGYGPSSETWTSQPASTKAAFAGISLDFF